MYQYKLSPSSSKWTLGLVKLLVTILSERIYYVWSCWEVDLGWLWYVNCLKPNCKEFINKKSYVSSSIHDTRYYYQNMILERDSWSAWLMTGKAVNDRLSFSQVKYEKFINGVDLLFNFIISCSRAKVNRITRKYARYNFFLFITCRSIKFFTHSFNCFCVF